MRYKITGQNRASLPQERLTQKINQFTTLIDLAMYGYLGAGAAYLVTGEKKCLIDCGSRTEAPLLVKTLKELGAFPPDIVIPTHAHYDHAQGINVLRREANKKDTAFKVIALEGSLPLLADPSYNCRLFGTSHFESINDVTPVSPGEIIDLGGIKLRVCHLPGHSSDHLGLLDENNLSLFAGDAFGVMVSLSSYLPPFMTPSREPEKLLSAMAKFKQLDYEKICIAHYGCIAKEDAAIILERAGSIYESYWKLFEKNRGCLNNPDQLLHEVKKEMNPVYPKTSALSAQAAAANAVRNTFRKRAGKNPRPLNERICLEMLEFLAAGYLGKLE